MIDSGEDFGQHQPPLDLPPLDITKIYSWVTMQGAGYRDFSASRQEARTRFRQRVLLKQRVEASRKVRERVAFAQIAVPVPTAGAWEAASQSAEAVEGVVQATDPNQSAQPIPELSQVQTQEVIPEPAYTSAEETIAVSAQEPAEHHSQNEEETLPSASATPPDEEEIAVPEATAVLEYPSSSENEVSASQNEALSQNGAEKLESAPAASGMHEPDSSPDEDAADAEAPRHEKAGLSSRWYALRGVFAGDAEARTRARSPKWQVPALAIFSLAGGVGKTSLTATLGRVLAARGEQAFLVETTSPGLLPLFFGSREVKPGAVRTFSPPAGSDDAAVRAVTLDPQHFPEKNAPDLLAGALLRYARGSSRILIDIQTGSKTVAQRLLPVVSTVLVPLLADMNSVMSLHAVEAAFAELPEADQGEAGVPPIEPVYLLNQFDGSLPLHAEVRGLLQEQLGGRLLPFVMRRSAAVSEALAEGMTVVDYAPGSPVAEDYIRLAAWLSSAAPVAASGLRRLRWSES